VRALLALIAFAGSAHADELRPEQIPPKARALADRGRAYHDAGDYPHAISAFEEAYALAPSASLLFDLAQAYRLSGDCDDAVWMYRRYLSSNPSGDGRTLAESHLARCARPAVATATPNALAVAEPAPRAIVPPRGQLEQQAGGVLIVGGSVLLLAAGYFALDASWASGSVSDPSVKGGKGAESPPIASHSESSATYATWLGVTGVLTAGGGVALYLHGRRIERDSHVGVSATPHSAGFVWVGRF